MAIAKVGVKLEAKGGKAVENTFKNVGKSAETFDKKAGSLSGTLKKLAGVAVGLFAFRKIAQFMRDAARAAGIQETMEARLASSLKTAMGATKGQIKNLIDYAAELQKVTMYGDEQIISGMGILSTFQLTSEQIKEATKRMVDMAAGTERATGEQQDLSTIAMALGRALTMGAGALTRYGVVMSEAEKKAIELATGNEKLMLILTALDKNYKGIAEAMATTYAGQVKQAKMVWGDLKEEIGRVSFMMTSPLVEAFTSTITGLDETGRATVALFEILTNLEYKFMSLGGAITNTWDKVKIKWAEINLWSGKMAGWAFPKEKQIEMEEKHTKTIEDSTRAIKETNEYLNHLLETRAKQRIELILGTKSWEEYLDLMNAGIPTIEGVGDASETMANKIKSAFGTLAKSIISQVDSQITAIKQLRFELEGLSEDTNEQLNKSEERYGENLKQMARYAQERIDQIDEQIKKTREAMSRGWRGEIIELEEEKEKQKSIIARIGGEIVDIQAEAKKDELTVLQEAHQKEIDEIKEQARKKELEIQKELLEEQIAMTKGVIGVKAPGFFEKAVGEETALQPWQASQYQNIFNIVVEGDLTSEDALLKKLMDVINRNAELKAFGGE